MSIMRPLCSAGVARLRVSEILCAADLVALISVLAEFLISGIMYDHQTMCKGKVLMPDQLIKESLKN